MLDQQQWLSILIVIGVPCAYLWWYWVLRDPKTSEAASKQKSAVRETVDSTPISRAATINRTVFVSYRRQDSADITGRLTDKLVHKFGKESIYKDVDSIPLGVDFRKHIEQAVSKCDVLIAVIGKQWAGSKAETGASRLDDHRDHVRIEIESALNRDIIVIPVLVQGVPMPSEQELPPSLRGLAYRNGIPIRPDPDFHIDSDRLIRGIEMHFQG